MLIVYFVTSLKQRVPKYRVRGFEPGLELGLDSGLEPKITSSDFDG
jgi:hypothetical protein